MNKSQISIGLKVKDRRFGFTLIELLVVISIIGILSAVMMANISGIRERARDARRKSDLKELKGALRMYHNDSDDYPDPNNLSSALTEGTSVYIKEIPQDPLGTDYVYAHPENDQDNFTYMAVLENESNGDIAKSQSLCGITGGGSNDYYVCED